MNERIRELAEQSLAFAVETCRKDGHKYEWPDHIFMSLVMGRYTELLSEALVENMEVEGSDFYYNDGNQYGSVTVKFFVDCDPGQEMRGEEVKALFYGDEWKGTGRYRLNRRFAKHLLDSLK